MDTTWELPVNLAGPDRADPGRAAQPGGYRTTALVRGS